MIELLKKNTIGEYVLFALTSVIVFILFLFGCKQYNIIDFDSINLIFWEKLSYSPYHPYRDFFYPYGILNYFSNSSLFIKIFSACIAIFYLGIIYFYLNLIFGFKKISYVIYCMILFYVLTFAGVDNLIRYGSLPVFAIIFSTHLFYLNTYSVKKFLLFGITSGFLFSLMFDQGLYVFTLFFILYIVNFMTNFYYGKLEIKKENITTTISHFCSFFLGYLVGLLPFLVYLVTKESLQGFLENFIHLFQMGEYAKIPFFPSLKNTESLFLFMILLYSEIVILIKILKKEKLSPKNLVILGITFALLLGIQKSIIRPINSQLTLFSILILVGFSSDLVSMHRKKHLLITSNFILLTMIAIVIFTLGLTKQNFVSYAFNGKIVQEIISGKVGESCLESNLSNIKMNSKNNDLGNYLQKAQHPVYIFPQSALAVLDDDLNVSFFPNIYDATSELSQLKTISYLRKEKIPVILLDSSKTVIQDGVPDIIRASTLFLYIVNNYYISDHISSYLLLTKKRFGESFFFSTSYKSPLKSKYLQNISQINLENIPLSEGRKLQNVKPENLSFVVKNAGKVILNNTLLKDPIDTKNTFLFISSQNDDHETDTIILKRDDGIESTVSFRSCKGENVCVINLERIPIFFEGNKLVMVDAKGENIFSLVKIENSDVFW